MTKSDVDEFSGPVRKKRRCEESMLPPCRVCGSKASGYHYGAISCGACKAFFRRSILIQTPYKCKGNDQCLIKPDQKIPCSYCRFQKCLEIGMSKDGTKMGRYTIQRKSAVIKEVKDIEARVILETETAIQRQKEKAVKLQTLADVVLEADMNYPFAPPEILRDVSTEQRKYKEMKKMQEKLYGSMKPVPNNMYQHLFYTFGLELDDRREKAQMCLTETEKDILANINFAKALPGFKALDIDDQVILLKDTEEKLMTCASCGTTFTIDEAEVIYNDGFDLNFFRCAEVLRPLSLTTEEIALMKALCVFNPDGCLWPPKDREKIAEIQQNYLDALQFVLAKNKRQTAKVLGRLIYSITVMKDCLHWYSRKSETWTTMFPGVKCPELVEEWLGPLDSNSVPEFKWIRKILLEESPPTLLRHYNRSICSSPSDKKNSLMRNTE